MPKYLIIIFDRETGNKNNIKILFPEILDTKDIVISPTENYQLYAVVKYYSSCGQYAAYCRSPIDKCWYFYNDSSVTFINEDKKIDIQDNGTTYALFYKNLSVND